MTVSFWPENWQNKKIPMHVYEYLEQLFASNLSPQRFSLVSWQHQKYWTIITRLLCLLCVTPLVCLFYSSFAPPSNVTFFSSWWQRYWELITPIPVLQGSSSMSSRQPQMIHVFADSRIKSLCHALRICAAYAPPESCRSVLLVH